MISYFKKMSGGGQRPPRVNITEILWSWTGAFLGITPVAFLNYNLFSGSDFVYIIGSFGASAVLIYGAVRSPLAQPRKPGWRAHFIGIHRRCFIQIILSMSLVCSGLFP